MILELVGTTDTDLIIDSDNGYLAAFSMYLASLVIFRVVFATLHILRMKFRYNCRNDYKVEKRNMTKDFKKIKNEHRDGESTDDEFIEAELKKIYEKNKNKIDSSVVIAERLDTDHRQRSDATIAFIDKKHRQDGEESENDEDYDFKELADADVEEAEDRIYSEYKKRAEEGLAVDENVMRELAGSVGLDKMNESVVMSAKAGTPHLMFTKRAYGGVPAESSMLDISAMISNHKEPNQARNPMADILAMTARQNPNYRRKNTAPEPSSLGNS